MPADHDSITAAVENLTDAGSRAFRASAIARTLRVTTMGPVTRSLLAMVTDGKLCLRFDLVCPDNGRTIKSFTDREALPIGDEISSDLCASDEPFTVEERHIWVQFAPTEEFRIGVRQHRSHAKEDTNPAQGDDPAGLLPPDADRLDAYRQRGDLKVEQNYYGPVIIGDSTTVTQGDKSPVAREGSSIATGGGTAATSGGAAASGGSAAAAGGSQAELSGIMEKAKKSRWFQVWGGISVLLLVTTTVLVVTGAFGTDWAGYGVAVITALIGVPPLFGD